MKFNKPSQGYLYCVISSISWFKFTRIEMARWRSFSTGLKSSGAEGIAVIPSCPRIILSVFGKEGLPGKKHSCNQIPAQAQVALIAALDCSHPNPQRASGLKVNY